MGQRLVVSIKRNLEDEKSLCKIYYHWSGYTTSSMEETYKIINHLNQFNNIEKMSDKDIQLSLIRFCENNGGGIDGPDLNYIKNLFPNESFIEKGYSRNEGLIAISDKDQEDMQGWSEGDVEIGINDKKVSFHVDRYIGQTEPEVKAEYENTNFDEVINLKHNIEDCSYEQFAELYDQLKDKEGSIFKNTDGKYYSFIY